MVPPLNSDNMGIAIAFFVVYGCIGIALVAALVYVIYRRIRDMSGENFEQRDN